MESDGANGLLAAQARAARRAVDLSADLERRADRLLAVAPKLRAKAANMVVERSGPAMWTARSFCTGSTRSIPRGEWQA
ncbi:DUF1403 family protein [Mesorhizobium sp. M0322]|uniref:DUF1403 family protein n=1 Tax=Mesorhizobium sp. M0322 TaxID=2956937 RepID=UPI00333AAD30